MISLSDRRLADLADANEAAARLFASRLAGSWAAGYLASRGVAPHEQHRWQAGYAAPGWDCLARQLRGLGYPGHIIEAAGLARRTERGTLVDTFRDRAVLPVRASDGTLAAFIGRAPDHAPPRVPKYLNSPATRLYRKRDTLFGLWEARAALAAGARPVIVEGPFDAMAVTAAAQGTHVGVSPCGAALGAGHVAALTGLAGPAGLAGAGVLVAFDPDAAGRRAAVRAYHLLSHVTGPLDAVGLPAGEDPAHIRSQHGPAALAGLLMTGTYPLADIVTDAAVGRWARWLRHPEGRLNALRATAPVIAAMPPADVARQVARLAGRLELGYQAVTEAITSALPGVIAGRPELPAGPGVQGG